MLFIWIKSIVVLNAEKERERINIVKKNISADVVFLKYFLRRIPAAIEKMKSEREQTV